MALTPYPPSLPIEAIMIIIDKLRGSIVPTNDLILASWNLVGYGLSQVNPRLAENELNGGSDIIKAFNQEADISNEEAIAALESLIPKSTGSVDDEAAKKLPWAKIIKVAVKILLGILVI